MKHVSAAAIGIILLAGGVSAQQTYLSYGDAINTLIDPGSDAFDPFGGPGNSPTSCGQLYEDAFDFLTPAGTPDPTKIGPNLVRNCNVSTNVAYGSTRSLGFAGDVPTSTFVPFETDRVRRQVREGENDSADGTTGTEGLTISSSGRAGRQVFFWSELGTTDIDATIHESRQESDSVVFGATVLTARGNGGISISVGRSDGTSAPPELSVVDFPDNGQPGDDVLGAIYDAYRDACAALPGGRSESAGIGVTGFHSEQLGGADLQIYAGAAVSRTEYSNNLCYYGVQAAVGPIFASRIQGETDKFGLSAGAMLSSTVPMGRVTLRPAFGFEYTHTRRPGYRETEASIASVAQAVADLGVPTPVLTGASLDYASQKTDSLRMRIGGSAFFPAGRRGAVSASAFFVKEFHDDPQTVTATFNEDLRDTPTRFSFFTNPLPSDYLEFGIGYHRGADRPGGFGWDVRLASRLGDSFYETHSVSLMVRSDF